MSEYVTRSGIFVIAPIEGEIGERIETLQRTHDPRILKLGKPHVTLAGSSGMGPIDPQTSLEELDLALMPVAEATAPISVKFSAPMRFMQTEIVVLPLDPHGPLRALHEKLKTSGLRSVPPRFYFTPHVTLSLYRELPRPALASLLGERFPAPAMLMRIECHLTRDTGESRKLAEYALNG